MKTTSALAMITAGMAAAATMSGCGPFGGCGAPDDPTNVSAFVATAKGSVTSAVRVDGIAATPGGVWILSNDGDGAAQLTEYDHLGGKVIVEHVVPARQADDSLSTGLAAEGDVLWYGDHSASAGDHAFRIDFASNGLSSISLSGEAYDFAWDGSSLIAVQGWASVQSIDPSNGALRASMPVQRLSALRTVAYHDGETWVGLPGQPVLIYATDGTLLATANIDLITAATSDVHMTFVGDDLVVASGAQIATYAIDRTQPTPAS